MFDARIRAPPGRPGTPVAQLNWPEVNQMSDTSASPWPRRFLILACLFGASGVALAAIGAHALDDILIGKAVVRFDTALRMHLIHAPALLALAASASLASRRWWLAACGLMSLGTLVFCGGLYLAAIAGSTALLPIVPAGGSALILSWLVAGVAFALAPRPPGAHMTVE
jgi:uncharacterized membrane protein YgdD (TMEM256/DUF423 family)